MPIVRAGERFRTSQPGIESWHVLSAGAHYDPARVRLGPFVGIDEHVLAPGAGFASHAHRGVTIVSWVVSGTLAHRPAAGDPTLVGPGEVLVQHTGSGIRHAEANASPDEPLRLVQTTLLSDGDAAPATVVGTAPVDVGEGLLLGREPTAPAYVYVLSGSWRDLAPGDFAYVAEPPEGAGELLVWCVRSKA